MKKTIPKLMLLLIFVVFVVLLLVSLRDFFSLPTNSPHWRSLPSKMAQNILDSFIKEKTPRDYEDPLLQFHISLGERDLTQQYNKHFFTVVATEWSKLSTRPVCIATQSSVERLHWLVNMTGAWSGPVSVAIFTPDIEFQLSKKYIAYLRVCFPSILRQVSFHFVYPVNRPPRLTPGEEGNQTAVNCNRNYKQYLNELLSQRPAEMMSSWREQMAYPQNVLRNAARSTCPTPYILCPDVDMFPTSERLEGQLKSFLNHQEQRKCVRCAYVIPVYEVLSSVASVPTSKRALLRLVGQEDARPFHTAVFKPNQELSKLYLWEHQMETTKLRVVHTVKKYEFWYEPMFIAGRDTPPFDERFVGYGNTRNSQIYEMFLAGWTFKILNNAFLIHWGYQTIKERPPWRIVQARTNSLRLRAFLRELTVRYDKDPLNMLNRYPLNSTKYEIKKKQLKKNNPK